MNYTLSNKYFLQALDAYPYSLSEVIENLEYALSYDAEHAGAHCLLGRLYLEQLKMYDKAAYHFERALAIDMNYVVIYEYYSLLLISACDYEKALKLIRFANTIKGVNNVIMSYRESIIYENLKKYNKAIASMEKAYHLSCNEEERIFIHKQLARIKKKMVNRKDKNKKKIKVKN